MIETSTNLAGGDFTTSDPKSTDTPELAAIEGAVPDEQALVNEVIRKYDERRQMRRPYEIQWYINASALRGFPDVRFNAELNRLEIKREPQHRKRHRINLIKSKYIARLSKFLKTPRTPSVIPATTDREDIMNARATQKALEYATVKFGIKKLYRQAMQWVPVTGKCFIWTHWSQEAIGQQLVDGKTAPILGDVALDFGSAFEFLPADPGIEDIAEQPEIMRAKMVLVKDIESAHPELKDQIKGESNEADVFFYQRQIADLGTRQQGMASRATQQMEDNPAYVLRIELFTKPCPAYPKGRYVVVAGTKLLRFQDSLPGDFRTCHKNPYPVVEFCDQAAPGQFWPDAFIERLIGLQSEYNEYRSKIAENLAMHFFPHLLTPVQANLSQQAYTSEAGQILEYTQAPGIDKPDFLQPVGVLGDAWNILQHIKTEFDDVSMITPSVLGSSRGSSSGYQVNLLQEAADVVHLPSVEMNAEALQELYAKIRRLMKIGYDLPRLVAVAGRNNIPEVQEFSRENIDEAAEVYVEVTDMLPDLRSARVDMIRAMFKDGLFGDPLLPKTQRKAQDMIRTSYAEFEYDREARDEEQAQRENLLMERGEMLPRPMVWEDHQIHWESHTDLFKSPETEDWTPEQWRLNVWHIVNHLQYINPNQALMLAAEFGLQNEAMSLQLIYQAVLQQQMAAGIPPDPTGGVPPGPEAGQGPPPPGGAPPQPAPPAGPQV
jgi:hypothetical protein